MLIWEAYTATQSHGDIRAKVAANGHVWVHDRATAGVCVHVFWQITTGAHVNNELNHMLKYGGHTELTCNTYQPWNNGPNDQDTGELVLSLREECPIYTHMRKLVPPLTWGWWFQSLGQTKSVTTQIHIQHFELTLHSIYLSMSCWSTWRDWPCETIVQILHDSWCQATAEYLRGVSVKAQNH